MSRSRLGLTYLILTAWTVWIPVSAWLLMAAHADAPFTALYLGYVLLSGGLLMQQRKDLLAPRSLFVLAGFLAFGLNIPLIYVGNRSFETSDLTSIVISDESLFRVLVTNKAATSGVSPATSTITVISGATAESSDPQVAVPKRKKSVDRRMRSRSAWE